MPEDQNEALVIGKNGIQFFRRMSPPPDTCKQQGDHQRRNPAYDEHAGPGAFELFQHG